MSYHVAEIKPRQSLQMFTEAPTPGLMLLNASDRTMYVRYRARSITVSYRKPANYGRRP